METKTFSIKFIAYTGLMTALVYVCTLIGVTAGSYNFNIGDGAILICGALFNPLTTMIAGGIGAFLADLTTYPATMLYTLIIKAIEGLLAGVFFQLIYRHFDAIEAPTKKQTAVKITLAGVNCIVCTMLMAGGYFLCKWLFYGTLKSALISLPKNIVQAAVTTAIAMLVLYVGKLEKMRPKTFLSIIEIVKEQNATTPIAEQDYTQECDEIDFAQDETQAYGDAALDCEQCDTQDCNQENDDVLEEISEEEFYENNENSDINIEE